MRKISIALAALIALVGLSACETINEATGTDREDRCAFRQAAIERFQAREDELSDAEKQALKYYQDYVAVVCEETETAE